MVPRILFITHVNPFIFSDATSLRVHHLIKALSQLGEIYCISITPRDQAKIDDDHLIHQICKEYIQWDRLAGSPLASILRGMPTETSAFYSTFYRLRLQQIIRSRNIQLLWLDHIFMKDYFSHFKHQLPIVFGTHNIESEMYRHKGIFNRALFQKIKYRLKAQLTEHLERTLTKSASFFVTVSERDKHYYAALNLGLKIYSFNSCIDVEYYQSHRVEPINPVCRPMLLYTGLLKYEATYDAVLYFYSSIMPHLDKYLKDYVFYAVGKDPVPAVRKLAGPRVVITGFVPSTLPYFRSADVFVVPLRGGSGTRLKIIEAMASGTPIVTTHKGCEGLEVQDGIHMLIADDPDEFAWKTAQLCKDHQLCIKLASNARALVKQRYDWRSLSVPLGSMIKEILPT